MLARRHGRRPPAALTHTGLALGCAASDDTLIWTELLPQGDPRRVDVGDDPFTTWTPDLKDPDAVPTTIYEGSQSGLSPVAGTDSSHGRPRGGRTSCNRRRPADFGRDFARITVYDAP